MLLLNSLKKKSKPFSYIDSHAGAGLYNLRGSEAQQTGESELGIKRLQSREGCKHALIDDYLALIDTFAASGYYPGSPAIAAYLCREQDHLQLCEWHNSEIVNLKRNLADLSQTKTLHCHHRNGFEALGGLTPPEPKRGLALIDPSYELKDDYRASQLAIRKLLKQWATGMVALWYPLLATHYDREKNSNSKAGLSEKMVNDLADLPAKSILDVRFWPQGQTAGGMYGSGMLLINPPWQSEQQLAQVLPALLECMRQSPDAGYALNWLKVST